MASYPASHGITARAILACPVRCFGFLLRRAFRVRTTEFRERLPEGVCSRKIICREADREDPETEEIALAAPLWGASGTLRF